MSKLSYKEKSSWGMLIALAVIGGLYFHAAWGLWQADGLVVSAAFRLLFGYTILLVVALIAYHVLIAVLSKPEVEDERDRLIEWRASHVGGLVLAFGVISVILHIMGAGWLGYDLFLSPIAIAHFLLLVMVAATVVELALKLYYYRRGF